MAHAVQWTRSLLFNIQMYLVMALMALIYLPMAVVSRDWALRAVHDYCRYVRWSAAWMIG
ncbi:hypothetical protein LCGC14_2355770, partial [marine sediment metagenome]